MSIGDSSFHFSPSGLPDAKDFQLALELTLKQWKIVTGVTIAFCAGYNEAADTVYIDEAVPEFWEYNGRRLDIWRGSLFIHEHTEADILQKYGQSHYQWAHTVATYLENAYVQSKGIDVNAYENEFWAPIIKAVGARKSYPRTPRDLDLAPYIDSGDESLVKRMTFV